MKIYLVKCSFIRSSRMFSGRLPTQRCLVSRTMTMVDSQEILKMEHFQPEPACPNDNTRVAHSRLDNHDRAHRETFFSIIGFTLTDCSRLNEDHVFYILIIFSKRKTVNTFFKLNFEKRCVLKWSVVSRVDLTCQKDLKRLNK